MPEHSTDSEFYSAIQRAIAVPATANLRHLLHQFESVLAQSPETAWLAIAGNLLALLTDVLAARAHYLLEEWEEKYHPVEGEPILTTEMLQPFLRQTMTLNLEGMVDQSGGSQSTRPIDSVIGSVDKTNLLEFLDRLEHEQTKQQALAVAHDEDVSAWIQAIAQGIPGDRASEISLLELQRSLQMPLVEVWLALLLGGYHVEQRGDFYQRDSIWIQPTCPALVS
ncbi:hypothetical protein ACN4EK_01930 [Pantanalinema rosaneae CENA516]|uniref:hypothetical protein n=1 Tax=Pantanalinema rosaneae TaxID=1620701 RepID=UPI003D6E6A60